MTIRPKFTIPAVLVLALALGLVRSTALAAEGKNRVEFRAIYQQTLWFDITALDGPGWTVDHANPPRALMDGAGVPLDLVHTFDAVVYRGVNGQERGSTSFKLNDTDSFVRKFRDSFNESPGKEGMYTLNMEGQIVSGTGRFANATGSIAENGTYLVWYEMENDHLIVKGKYVASISANIDLVNVAN